MNSTKKNPAARTFENVWSCFPTQLALLLMLILTGCGDEDSDPTQQGESKGAVGGNGTQGSLTDQLATDDKLKTSAAPWFRDVTELSHVDFVHATGDSDEKPFPAANGSGVAVIDFDLDGLQDLYFATGCPIPVDLKQTKTVNRMFRNLGDWEFSSTGNSTGTQHNGYSAGVTVGDIDNDGFPDLYVTCFGKNQLYRNLGDGTFEEIGAANGAADKSWGTSAALLDFDTDGLLDIYVCNYGDWTLETNEYCGYKDKGVRTFCNPRSIKGVSDALLKNMGDGSFENWTSRAGLDVEEPGRGQGVVTADFNEDGLIDIYVGNDLDVNFLFFNQGDGTFSNATELSGAGYDHAGNKQAGMGIATADFNRDGRLDLFVTNFSAEHNALYINQGNNQFDDVSFFRGMATDSLKWIGWGTAIADFNLDGWPDAMVTNGEVDNNLHLLGQATPYEQPALLWKNVHGKFDFLGSAGGDYFDKNHAGRALAVADLDNDGDLDVVVGHQDTRPALLENISTESNDANQRTTRQLILVGRKSNRSAIGASVVQSFQDGTQLRQAVTGGGSYLSASATMLTIHEGTTVKIIWPDNSEVELSIPPDDETIVITQH